INREIERLLDVIQKNDVYPHHVIPRMKELEGERVQVDAQIKACEPGNTITLHPATMAKYERDVGRLAELLDSNSSGESDDLIAAVRRLIAEVVVSAGPNGKMQVEV